MANAKDKITHIAIEDIIAPLAWNARSGDYTKVVDPETGQTWEGFLTSVRENGIETPIEVRPKGKDKVEIVTGFRRHLAAKTVGMKEVPCIVREMSEIEARERNIRENTDRENLKGADLAWAIQQLAKLKLAEGVKETDVVMAKAVNRSQPYVSKLNRIMAEVKPSITKDWREAKVGITVEEMHTLSQFPKEKQDDAFKEILKKKETNGNGESKGKSAWIKTAETQAYKLGFTFGVGERLQLLKILKGDSLTIVENLPDAKKEGLGVRIKSTATQIQRQKFAKKFEKGFAAGLIEPKVETPSKEEEDEEEANA